MALLGSFCFPLESSWALLKPYLLRFSPSCSPLIPFGTLLDLIAPYFGTLLDLILGPWGLSWVPWGHHWSSRNCVTIVEFTYLAPFCHPLAPPVASWLPFGPLGLLLLPFGILLGTFETLLAPFVTRLLPFGALWNPPGSHCPLLWDPPGRHFASFGALLVPFGSPLVLAKLCNSRRIHLSRSLLPPS